MAIHGVCQRIVHASAGSEAVSNQVNVIWHHDCRMKLKLTAVVPGDATSEHQMPCLRRKRFS